LNNNLVQIMKRCFLVTVGLFVFSLSGYAAGNFDKMTCATASCHDNLRHFKVEHKPLKSEGCTVCHQVKSAVTSSTNPHPKLTPINKDNVNVTCRVCHDEKVQGHFKFAHGPIEKKSCIECHNPHGSENAKMLKLKMPDLCVKCHESKQNVLNFGHGVIFSSEKSCLNCHASHFTNYESLLQTPVKEACLQCHNKEQKSPKGATVRAVGEQLKTLPVHHKPVEEGKCTKCHDPHGSADESFLMDDVGPPTYALCVSCHKKPMIEDVTTNTSTKFRNGTTNLHYLHLHNAKKGPRTCNTCHDPHATKQPHLILDQVTLFEMNTPIQFKQNLNGGNCTTACHGEKTYDRLKDYQNAKGR